MSTESDTEHTFRVTVARFSSAQAELDRQEAKAHLWQALRRENKWSETYAMSIEDENA